MPGPAPKPADQRRRTNAPMANTLKLPKDGRDGPVPDWPLSRMRAGERAVWSDLWSTPQAAAWELMGWTRTVARYCRVSVAADAKDAPVSLLGEVRQMEDRLGLSPMALLRLRWEITDDDEPKLASVTNIDEERFRGLGA